jgi:hypothetical protein
MSRFQMQQDEYDSMDTQLDDLDLDDLLTNEIDAHDYDASPDDFDISWFIIEGDYDDDLEDRWLDDVK